MKFKLLFIITAISMFGINISAYAQKSTDISGIVTTSYSYPLNHVLVKSLNTGATVNNPTLWDIFLLKVPGKDILVFSASGFNTKTVKIKKSQNISVDLTYSNTGTSFEDAVNNNHISEENLQTAIKTGKSKGTKDYSKYKTIFDAINSEIFPVKVVGNTVTSKRIQSFSLSSNIMFVVDDMVVTDISTILPSEIKSMEFIDGVRASYYGSSGANGVLKITLKGSH